MKPLVIAVLDSFHYSITMRLSCAMLLNKYPLDSQKCVLRFSSSELKQAATLGDSFKRLDSIADGLMVDQQYFSGNIQLSEDAKISQGAMQYSVTLDQEKETAYRTLNCPTNGKKHTHISLA